MWFGRVKLEPLLTTGGRIRVWLAGHYGWQLHCIGHRLLQQASCLIF
jgi:hypothetical protein